MSQHSAAVQAIERGGVYKHPTHDRVEVTGIWEGKQWTDTVSRSAVKDEQNPIVVRYVPHGGSDWSDELAGTLDEFLDAIEAAN